MGFRCCVPNCRGNYDNGPKVSCFSFPKEKKLRKKWITAIHRKDFQPSQYSRVSVIKIFCLNQIFFTKLLPANTKVW